MQPNRSSEPCSRGNPLAASKSAFSLGLLFLPDADLKTRTKALVKRMKALLPEAVEVSEAEVETAKALVRNETYLRPIDDLAACGDNATCAADLTLGRADRLPSPSESPLRHFSDRERAGVRTLLVAFLSALRDDPTIVREVRARLQNLAIEEVRALAKTVEGYAETVEGYAETVASIVRHRAGRAILSDPALVFERYVSPDQIQPSDLLDARFEVVPFFGREAELAAIRAFRDQDDDIAAAVIEGEGGLGKTRLAMEAVRRAEADGWTQSGFLKPIADPEALQTALADLAATGEPTFVVADYGEDRPEQLAALMAAWLEMPPGGPKRRLLLLCRQQALLANRLEQVKHSSPDLGRASTSLRTRMQPILLSGALRVRVEDRAEVFRKAQVRFADCLTIPLEGLPEPPDTLSRAEKTSEEPKNEHSYQHLGLPLYLHMAAYASLFGTPSVRKADLLAFVLDRNWAYTKRLLEAEAALVPLHLSQAHLHEVLTVATLALAARPPADDSAPDARACLAPTTFGRKAEKDVVTDEAADFLTAAFGVVGSDGERALDAVRPDALGEGLVFATLPRKKELLDAVLGMDEASCRSACTVLVRAALGLVDDPEAWILDLLPADRLQQDPGLALALLFSIPDDTVALRGLAAFLSSVVVNGMAPDNEDRAPLRASLLGTLGIRLSAVGRRDDALAASQEAVDIYRRLAERAPDAFLPDLAASLNNLGGDLSAVGRRDDALDATQEAVGVYRTLAERAPDAFLPDLARSLNNLGIRLSAVGRRDDALDATQEAVDIRRTLAERAPDAFLPDLARSLSVLGDRQMETESPADAVASYAESLRLLTRFVQAHPEAFRGLTMATIQDYLTACQAVEAEPEVGLLMPLFAALGIELPGEDGG